MQVSHEIQGRRQYTTRSVRTASEVRNGQFKFRYAVPEKFAREWRRVGLARNHVDPRELRKSFKRFKTLTEPFKEFRPPSVAFAVGSRELVSGSGLSVVFVDPSTVETVVLLSDCLETDLFVRSSFVRQHSNRC